MKILVKGFVLNPWGPLWGHGSWYIGPSV